jgi:hypothetical protein
LKLLIQRAEQLEDQLQELTRTQRALTSQAHRLDLRPGNELNVNLQHQL